MDIFEWSRRLILNPELTFALQNLLTGITPSQCPSAACSCVMDNLIQGSKTLNLLFFLKKHSPRDAHPAGILQVVSVIFCLFVFLTNIFF